jgi:hypothetical protein
VDPLAVLRVAAMSSVEKCPTECQPGGNHNEEPIFSVHTWSALLPESRAVGGLSTSLTLRRVRQVRRQHQSNESLRRSRSLIFSRLSNFFLPRATETSTLTLPLR